MNTDVAPNSAVELSNVMVRYGHHVAIHDVSGSFSLGSLTAMAGPNGAGKSTLLKVIAGIIPPNSGSVIISPICRGKIAYLPQSASIARDFPISVMQMVCTGFWSQIGDMGRITDAMMDKAHAALVSVGLQGLEQQPITAMSGGQFQRLLFARVILQDPMLIMLDEPFASVDEATTARLIQVLLDWHAQGRTIVCVLHDLLLIRKYFPESFLLAGKCLGRGHTHHLFEQKLLSFDLDMAEIKSPSEES